MAAWLREQGFPEAARNVDRRTDTGDVLLAGPVLVECKDRVALRLAEWLAQARLAAGRTDRLGAVFVKRKGSRAVGQSYVVMLAEDYAHLLRLATR